MTFRDGEVHQGAFENWLQHGAGTIIYVNGDRFSGNFINGERHGRGTYVFRSGEKYVGEYKNSKRDGYGVLTNASGVVVYSGLWIAGRKASDLNNNTNGSESDLVLLTQIELNRLGFSAGFADGVLGPQTQNAVRRAQRSLNLREDGIPSQALLNILRRQTSSSPPVRSSTLGYIAIYTDLETLALGWSLKKNSEAEAIAEANRNCQAHSSGKPCQKLLSGTGLNCVVISRGNGGVGASSNSTLTLTRTRALEQCNRFARPSTCKVVFETCDNM